MMLLQFAGIEEAADSPRELHYQLLEAAIVWHKCGTHLTGAEVCLLEDFEREALAEAWDIVHGNKLHPDEVLGDAVRRMARERAERRLA